MLVLAMQFSRCAQRRAERALPQNGTEDDGSSHADREVVPTIGQRRTRRVASASTGSPPGRSQRLPGPAEQPDGELEGSPSLF